jgi:hypothetical protein
MGAGRGRSRCALWGGLSLGVGTLAYALFSPSSVGCSTNVVVLTRSAVTARGCAAYSVVAHLGVGLIVLGAVLLLGSFALALRIRRLGAADAAIATSAEPIVHAPVAAPAAQAAPASRPVAPAVTDRAPSEPVVAEPVAAGWVERPGQRESERTPEPAVARTRPIAPGEDVYDDGGNRPDEPGLLDSAVRLPPGWYGNPDNPGRPVQWWDGTRLTDGPG